MTRLALLLLAVSLCGSAAAQSRASGNLLEAVIRNELELRLAALIGEDETWCVAIKQRTTLEDTDPDPELVARFAAGRPTLAPSSKCSRGRARTVWMWLTEPVLLADHDAEVRMGYYAIEPGINDSGYTIRLQRQQERWKVVGRIVNYPNVIAW